MPGSIDLESTVGNYWSTSGKDDAQPKNDGGYTADGSPSSASEELLFGSSSGSGGESKGKRSGTLPYAGSGSGVQRDSGSDGFRGQYYRESGGDGTDTADISLLDTVRFTKPIHPSVRSFEADSLAATTRPETADHKPHRHALPQHNQHQQNHPQQHQQQYHQQQQQQKQQEHDQLRRYSNSQDQDDTDYAEAMFASDDSPGTARDHGPSGELGDSDPFRHTTMVFSREQVARNGVAGGTNVSTTVPRHDGPHGAEYTTHRGDNENGRNHSVRYRPATASASASVSASASNSEGTGNTRTASRERPRSASTSAALRRNSSTGRNNNSGSSTNRYSTYRNTSVSHSRYLRSREALEAQAEVEFKKTHNFQPKLFTRTSSRGRGRGISASVQRERGRSPSLQQGQRHATGAQQSSNTLMEGKQSVEDPTETQGGSETAGATEPVGGSNTYPPTTQQRQEQRKRLEPPSRRIEELHSAGRNRHQERELQRKELEKLELSTCTFRPQIARGSRRILQQKEELRRLQDDIDYYRSTGELPIEQEEEGEHGHIAGTAARGGGSAARRKCPSSAERSLSPVARVSMVSNSSGSGGGGGAAAAGRGESVSERLYREAQEKEVQMRWIRQQVEEARAAQYTFQPCLNPFPRPTAPGMKGKCQGHVQGQEQVPPQQSPPLHERLAQMQRDKKEYMHALRASIEEEQGRSMTFQPHILPNSQRLAQQRRFYGANKTAYFHPNSIDPLARASRDGAVGEQQRVGQRLDPQRLSGEREAELVLGFDADVGTRLLNEGRVQTRRKQELQHEYETELAESMVPAPISRGSQKILQNKGLEE